MSFLTQTSVERGLSSHAFNFSKGLMMVLHGKHLRLSVVIYLYQISLFKRPWTFLFAQPHLSLPAVQSSDKSKCSTCILETDTFPFDPLLGFIWFLLVCFFFFQKLYAFVNHFIRTFRSLTYCGEKHIQSRKLQSPKLDCDPMTCDVIQWQSEGKIWEEDRVGEVV